MSTQINYIKAIIQKIQRNFLFILIGSGIFAVIIAFYVSSIDTKVETFSKIFPLSFSKSSNSPIDAIKAQFGISDKTDFSVIYNIKELVGSKTLSTRIANTPPSKNKKFKNIAQWLIHDFNSHCGILDKKIKLKPSDSSQVQYIGASLLTKNVEVNVEKTEFTKIITTSHDKELSKEINLAILAEISEYYVQVATEKPRNDLDKIKFMRDSLKDELGAVESAIAGFQDANQLSVKYSTGIPQTKLLRERAEIEQLYATTATAYQNARFKLLSESPIFQILDFPGEPYNYIKPSWLKMSIIGFIGFFIILSLFVCRKVFIQMLVDEIN